MNRKWLLPLAAPLCLAVSMTAPALPESAPASAPAPSAAVVTISRTVEGGKPMLVAKVTLADKPVAGVTVAFFLSRTFGDIALGKDSTLDDGTAAVEFADSLPGDDQGQLNIRTELTAPEAYAGQNTRFALPAARKADSRRLEIPRTLWASHAPFGLIATLGVLLGGVWLTYTIVVGHIIKIARSGPKS